MVDPTCRSCYADDEARNFSSGDMAWDEAGRQAKTLATGRNVCAGMTAATIILPMAGRCE
jgi:hypothetical protein